MDHAGTLPAKEAVKLRPADWRRLTDVAQEAAAALQSQAEQIEQLTRERDEADNALVDKYRDPQTGAFSFPGDVASIVRRLDTADASLAAALEALKPFAKCSEVYPNSRGDGNVGFAGLHDPRCPLTFDDYHRARQALSEGEQT
jgi:exonuclease VII small subunit